MSTLSALFLYKYNRVYLIKSSSFSRPKFGICPTSGLSTHSPNSVTSHSAEFNISSRFDKLKPIYDIILY